MARGAVLTRGSFHLRSYVAKTTEQLKHALGAMDVAGVELRAVEVVGEGSDGSKAFSREVERVRTEVGARSFRCAFMFLGLCDCLSMHVALALVSRNSLLLTIHTSSGNTVLSKDVAFRDFFIST